MFTGGAQIERVLTALGERLAHADHPVTELVVCGGAALGVLGLKDRATRDVDTLAMAGRSETGQVILLLTRSLPPYLEEQTKIIARDFNLPPDWLNMGPADLAEDLPAGFIERLLPYRYGDRLTVHFISRLDQIHFKFYAAVYMDTGRHYDDLVDLTPTGLTGQEAQDALESASITVNKNAIPFDTRPPRVTSGLRLGTPAVTSRGFGEGEMRTIARLIAAALTNTKDEGALARLRDEVQHLALQYPVPGLDS